MSLFLVGLGLGLAAALAGAASPSARVRVLAAAVCSSGACVAAFVAAGRVLISGQRARSARSRSCRSRGSTCRSTLSAALFIATTAVVGLAASCYGVGYAEHASEEPDRDGDAPALPHEPAARSGRRERRDLHGRLGAHGAHLDAPAPRRASPPRRGPRRGPVVRGDDPRRRRGDPARSRAPREPRRAARRSPTSGSTRQRCRRRPLDRASCSSSSASPRRPVPSRSTSGCPAPTRRRRARSRRSCPARWSTSGSTASSGSATGCSAGACCGGGSSSSRSASSSALFGALHAAASSDLKRLLAYSTVDNIGLVLIGVGAAGALAIDRAPPHSPRCAMLAALFHLVESRRVQGLSLPRRRRGRAGDRTRATSTSSAGSPVASR